MSQAHSGSSAEWSACKPSPRDGNWELDSHPWHTPSSKGYKQDHVTKISMQPLETQLWVTPRAGSLHPSKDHLIPPCAQQGTAAIYCCPWDQSCTKPGGRQGTWFKQLTSLLLPKTAALCLYEILQPPRKHEQEWRNKNIPYHLGCFSRD